MALTVETGAGVSGADAYASTTTVDTYWSNRPQNALSATWAAGATANKEGAIREASAYLDAVFGPHYRGVARGTLQGLLFPRSDALDDAGFPLPDLPQQLVDAVCELAARALSNPLADDDDRGNQIVRIKEKVDVIETDTQYAEGAQKHKSYGFVAGMLAPILDGTQPNAPTPAWNWT